MHQIMPLLEFVFKFEMHWFKVSLVDYIKPLGLHDVQVVNIVKNKYLLIVQDCKVFFLGGCLF